MFSCLIALVFCIPASFREILTSFIRISYMQTFAFVVLNTFETHQTIRLMEFYIVIDMFDGKHFVELKNWQQKNRTHYCTKKMRLNVRLYYQKDRNE